MVGIGGVSLVGYSSFVGVGRVEDEFHDGAVSFEMELVHEGLGEEGVLLCWRLRREGRSRR